jgi:hypothetical protein
MAERLQYADLNFQDTGTINHIRPATADHEPVTLAQLRANQENLNWKASARVSTAGNINLASPGSNLDGVAMNVGDRVLLRGQTAGAQNGIYLWNGPTAAMTRAPDANAPTELEAATVTIREGSSANSTFRQMVTGIVVDATALVWSVFGTNAPPASDATQGIIELATQEEVNNGLDNTRAVTPATLKGFTGNMKKFSQIFGDNSSNTYSFTHNLGTMQTQVAIWHGTRLVDCEVERVNINTMTVRTNSPVPTNAFEIVIVG